MPSTWNCLILFHSLLYYSCHSLVSVAVLSNKKMAFRAKASQISTLRHCIFYLVGGKIFCREFYFSQVFVATISPFKTFLQIFRHKHAFETFFPYFSSRAKWGLKNMVKMSRMYASVEIIANKSQKRRKSQDKHERNVKTQEKIFPPAEWKILWYT